MRTIEGTYTIIETVQPTRISVRGVVAVALLAVAVALLLLRNPSPPEYVLAWQDGQAVTERTCVQLANGWIACDHAIFALGGR